MPRIAIVAAMEREIAPLIRGWQVRTLYQSGHASPQYRLFENGDATVICAGMGEGPARRATATVIREIAPSRVVSVGFAGALDGSLKVGDVFEPRIVVNAKDGSRTDTGSGEKALVSCAFVAGKGQKSKLREAYCASAVDMEAAAVAQGAQAAGIEFAALKAISDAEGTDMPPMGEFIGDNGEFYRSRFVLYVAARPRLWGMTFALARNSGRASRALCAAIARYLERERVNLSVK
jgi:adenosylhomocysteine nucleosidase